MKRRQRIKWNDGDAFAVPLIDGSFALVQAVEHWMPRWVYTAVTNQRFMQLPSEIGHIPAGAIISLLAVSDDPFSFGSFARLGSMPPLACRSDFPNEHFVDKGYIGAKSYTPQILIDFLSAWHGLAQWNQYKDPRYFETLLIPGIERPTHVE